MQFSENRRPRQVLYNLKFDTSNLNPFFGGHKAVVRPVPIPNTAVKHSLADGSGPIGSARVGCRQIFFSSSDTSVFKVRVAGLVAFLLLLPFSTEQF